MGFRAQQAALGLRQNIQAIKTCLMPAKFWAAAWVAMLLSLAVSEPLQASVRNGDLTAQTVVLVRGETVLDRRPAAFLAIQPGRYLSSSALGRACIKPGLRSDSLLLFYPDAQRCQIVQHANKLILPQRLREITGRQPPLDLLERLDSQGFVSLETDKETRSKLVLRTSSLRSSACSCPLTVGGTVSGLVGDRVVLQNNGGDNREVTAAGPFAFTFSGQNDGSSYAVSVLTQPANPTQSCSVANALGNLNGANVTNVLVSCVTGQPGDIELSVGGTVTGLLGAGLVLQNNQGDDLLIEGNGPFRFPTMLLDGSEYEVSVLTEPSNPSQVCTLANAAGTLEGTDVDNIEVICLTRQFSVGGTVSGLAGTGLILRNNDDVDLPIENNGDFSFPPQDDGTTYDVMVLTQPSNPSQRCRISNGLGNLAGANFTGIQVVCTMNAVPQGETTCQTQTRPAGGLVAAIDFLASDADGDELTGVFTHQRDAGPVQEGLPSPLAVSCESDPGVLQCTVTGNAPAQAGEYRLELSVSDGAAAIELLSVLNVSGEVIFRDDFALPVCR